MTNRDLAAILLVRAIEESRPAAVPPATQVDALGAAGDPDDAAGWFTRRAAYLLRDVVGAYRGVLGITDLPRRLVVPAFAGAVLVGLASNYLGPTAKIHVVLNPMSVLIAWNLIVYAISATYAVRRRTRRAAAPTLAPAAVIAPDAMPSPAALARPTRPPWWLRPLVPALWLRWQRSAHGAGVRAGDLAQVVRAFWSAWLAAARPLVAATGRRVLHAAAIGIAVGAVIGMYVRGLFFDYNVVWQSTFIRDFEHVRGLLTVLLAPAAAVLGMGPPSSDETALLMTAAGAPAARWIHLYAASTALFVLGPRSVLIAAAWARERRVARRLTPDFTEPYYRAILEHARTLKVAELSKAIAADVRAECAAFADSVASFVCTALYDTRIVPRIDAFRTSGGRIAAFEDALREDCQAFQATLEDYLPTAQVELEHALSRKVAATVGRELAVEAGSSAGLASGIDRASHTTTTALGSSVGQEITTAVALAVSAAAAAIGGTVAGGFGESIGLAIIALLLETTGPIGFVIGTAGGLALAATGWWLGRRRLTAAMKRVHLPAAVTRLALRESKRTRIVTEGRAQCHAAVRSMMQETLEPLTPTIAEQIWTRIKPLLGVVQR